MHMNQSSLSSDTPGEGPITDGCEPPCGCWELNLGPLEEQSVFLTTEPSLQPSFTFLKILYVYGCFTMDVSGMPLKLELWTSVNYHVGAGN